MPKNQNILNLSNEPTPPPTSPVSAFARACEQIFNLAQKFTNLDLRLKVVEGKSSARDGRDGVKGDKGDAGLSGLNGKSITKINIDNNGDLKIVLDNVENNLGRVIGRDGKDGIGIKGDKGDRGDKGESIKGDPGINGKDGISILDAKLENNNLLLNLDGKWKNLGNVKGDRGVEGPTGKDGENIVGQKGDPGQSIKGEKGQDGKDFDSKEIIRLDKEISSIKQQLSSQSEIPEMTNGELERKIEALIGKNVKISKNKSGE